MTKQYQFSAQVWLYSGVGGWHFVTLPLETTTDINFYFSQSKNGWGALPVMATVGATTWKTSIFPDKKSKSYLLPIKADVRKAEKISVGDDINLTIDLHG